MKLFLFLKLFVIALGIMLFASCNQKQAYVDSNVVLEKFIPYKDFEKNYNIRLNHSKSFLDSILYDLSQMERMVYNIEENNEAVMLEFQKQRDSYMLLKEEHSASLDNYYQDEMKKITTRLNTYFIEYGQNNKLDYILGASGQGVMLYADTSLNISNEFIEYANARYEGKTE